MQNSFHQSHIDNLRLNNARVTENYKIVFKIEKKLSLSIYSLAFNDNTISEIMSRQRGFAFFR